MYITLPDKEIIDIFPLFFFIDTFENHKHDSIKTYSPSLKRLGCTKRHLQLYTAI